MHICNRVHVLEKETVYLKIRIKAKVLKLPKWYH